MVLLRVSLPGEASELELELLLSASVPVEDESESSESESRLLLSVSSSVEDESPDSESSVAEGGGLPFIRGPFSERGLFLPFDTSFTNRTALPPFAPGGGSLDPHREIAILRVVEIHLLHLVQSIPSSGGSVP